MWQQISLRAVGVIDSAELELGPGFTVITGETGAGKTMVITALGLLRGQRSDTALVRHGSPRSTVEAVVDLSDLPEVRRALEDTPAQLDDDVLILARTVTREGRSRAYLGGAAVPAGILGQISDQLVAVHGQSDQHRLLRPAAQRDALDRFAGEKVADLLARYRPAYAELREAERTLTEITASSRERAQELDLLRFGLAEIGAVAPEAGEDAALLAEEDRLAHAESLALAAGEAHTVLRGDGDGEDVGSLLAAAARALAGVNGHDAALDAIAEHLAEVGYVIEELGTDLAGYAQSVELDPARLAAVQDRRAALGALTRKYGPELVDVVDWAERACARAAALHGDDDRIDTLAAEIDTAHTALLHLAVDLADARQRAAVGLSERVGAELDALAMPHARLVPAVRIPAQPRADDLGPDGIDQVELLLSANPGAPALALGRGASGGELSRVMLALEVVLADQTTVPTFVFDEVDAGIGGRAAVEVGRRLALLARHAQVIAVTHLPQVAAFADRHFLVVKADDGAVTTSGVTRLEGAERVAELSRMLAGLDGSATAEAHAQELLDVASAQRRT